jgi:RND family efflux transporter MFP subunit
VFAVHEDISQDLAALRIQRDVPSSGRPIVRIVAVVAALLAVAAIVYFVVLPRVASRLFKTEIAATEVALVSPAQASITVTSTGYVVPQTISKAGAKTIGRVARVNVKEGDTVKTGDVIALLDDSNQKSSITAAISRVTVAHAQADTARANLADADQQVERNRALAKSGAVPRATLEDLEAHQKSLHEQVRAADAQAAAALSEVESLRTTLKDFTIPAPIDGTVVSKPVEVGELVGPGPGTREIAEIADFNSLRVETDVPEARLHFVQIGGPCEIILDAYPDKRFRGQAAELGQRVNRSKATVTVKVKFVDSTEGVLPDMAARVSFLSHELDAESIKQPPKKVVPANALADRAGVKVVFVIDSGKLRMTPVKVGGPVGNGFELLEGPEPGAKLVSNPSPQLVDGLEVKEKGAD